MEKGLLSDNRYQDQNCIYEYITFIMAEDVTNKNLSSVLSVLGCVSSCVCGRERERQRVSA